MAHKIYFRFAEYGDLEDLIKWRNDENTRKYSFDTKPINPEEHSKWFRNSLANPKRNIFVFFDKELKKLGQIRFDREGDKAEINITVNPEFRGKGIGTLALSKSSNIYFKNFDVKILVAKVKNENIASLKAFKNAGFNVYKKFEKHSELRFKACGSVSIN